MTDKSNDPNNKAENKKEENQPSGNIHSNISKWIYYNTSSSSYSPSLSSLYNYINSSNKSWSAIQWPDEEITVKTKKLYETIETLRKDVEETAKKFQQAKSEHAQKDSDILQLNGKIAELSKKEKLGFLLSRVNEAAQKLLLENEDFQKKFLEESECDTFVMSVDIRRSTELMSKARSPEQFARFMTTLCNDLEDVVKDCFGVFDKFTGDGILAFFPDFFSGADSGYYAIKAANLCHKQFQLRYKEFRSSFKSVLTDVGLGIGIDYGQAHLVQIAGGLTVVGSPVVYACRMSGAPADSTYLNQPGYEKISEKYSEYCFLKETKIDIKNEGTTLAYDIRLNGKDYRPEAPTWLSSK